MSDKTIFALSTPIGGAIAIIRISGNDTLPILKKVFSGKISHSLIAKGKLTYNGEVLDDIMAVFFSAPNSYTGEDMAELYIHGSAFIANTASKLLLSLGALPAQPGEFTKKAFMNGKLDLSQAEAVSDLILATAKRSAASALRQLSGELSDIICGIEERLTSLLAFIGAKIDYPDEMEDENTDINSELAQVHEIIIKLTNEGLMSKSIREGYCIALVGRPNVGKSSLLNRLLSEERAIVSSIPGTTRDVIEGATQFCLLPVRLFDTAGLHSSDDTVECLGMEKSRAMLKKSDLVYLLIDGSVPLSDDDRLLLCETAEYSRVIILTKSDLTHRCDLQDYSDSVIMHVSAKDGIGIDELVRYTASLICPDEESGIITNIRHIDALREASVAIEAAMASFELDCVSTDIQNALYAIGKITGNSASESVINKIFDSFCVGK